MKTLNRLSPKYMIRIAIDEAREKVRESRREYEINTERYKEPH